MTANSRSQSSEAWLGQPPEYMQALRRNGHGRLERVKVKTPTPAPDEVLVRNWAAGVNPVDLKATNKGYLYSTGVDGAGEIVELGGESADAAKGDRVMYHASLYAMRNGKPDCGSFSQYSVVPIAALVRIPDGISYQQAATIPCPGGTAQQILDGLKNYLERAQPDSSAVFVQGASGSVGNLVAQLLRIRFPEIAVIGSSSARNHESLRELGVHPVEYGSGTPESPQEFEWAQVDSVLRTEALNLVGIVDLRGGVGVDRHYQALSRQMRDASLDEAVLVCVISEPSSQTLFERGPRVHPIALGFAYDVATGAESSIPAYSTPINSVALMAEAIQTVADLAAKGEIRLPEPIAIGLSELPKLTIQDTLGKPVVSFTHDGSD